VKLCLSLLVELYLSGSVVASILQLLTQVLNVSGQSGSVLLSLIPVLPLNGKLFFKFFNSGLKLLDLFGILSTQGLFIFNLGRD